MKFHMLFAICFVFKIVDAPESGYKVLTDEIMYNLCSAFNQQMQSDGLGLTFQSLCCF